MKGIILAAGKSSRLFPATLAISKLMLNVYDKPMIYYPLSTLMSAGIKDIMIVSSPRDLPTFRELFGDGSQLGIKISYTVQTETKGIVHAFLTAKDFVGDDNVCLILGDNIFYGDLMEAMVQQSVREIEQFGGAELYGYEVANPERFGVAYEKDGQVYEIVEKPQQPKSNLAVTGLYFYDNNAMKYAEQVPISERGEYEITSLNNMYIQAKHCKLNKIGRGYAWLDTGTYASLLQANVFVENFQQRMGQMVACVEEIAYRKGFIDREKLGEFAQKYSKTEYGKYLKKLSEDEKISNS